MNATPFRWAVECVREVERVLGPDALETYYKRATRAAVTVLEEGLPMTLAFMASRGSDDPGVLLAYHLSMYLNRVVLADGEPEWSEIREECFGSDEVSKERVRDEVRRALRELAAKEGTPEMRYIESRSLELLNVIKRVAEGWHKVSEFETPGSQD
ncbi:type III-B CRISPR module-associated protein Cmr5 [Methanopyrus sp.]